MNIPLPTSLKIEESKGNKAKIVVEPCYPGYGVTVGNSLRRVLLSSIDGSAITSIKVAGAQHEFSTLPNVKEDLVDVILNIKKIRLKSYSDEPIVLNLKAKGQKTVTAGDIEKNAQVEVMNPDAPILNLTDKNASVEMELVVEQGMGYVTVDDRTKEKAEIGSILLDAMYSPVMKVGFEIENVRIGDRTDYEKLILNLETDGSLSPEEIMTKASRVLLNHFKFILNSTGGEVAEADNLFEDVSVEEAEATEDSAIDEKANGDAKSKKRGRPKKKE